ncbi:MAG: flgG [Sphingomonadales bacterium]|nr:flgG [Sphingomonadales bacterium]
MANAALQVARTGLDAQNTRMRVIANNLANVNTTGFKRDRATFETLAYQAITTPGAPSSAENKYAVGLSLGSGVQMTGTARIDTQGSFTTTSNSLDLAIEGSGYFQVRTPDGKTAYTRAGDFSLSPEGALVTSAGLPVQPAITIPTGAQAITIGSDGTVSATVEGAVTELGKIETANFVNAAGLQSLGDNLLAETPASGAPQVGAPGLEGRGSIRSGALEASNVNVVEELVDMIETQRAYEVNSKMISAADEMLKYVNQQL